MTQTLIGEPESGISYRVGAASPRPAARLILLHGVGGNETNLVAVANALDERIEILFARGPLAIGPAQYAWFSVRFGPNGPVIDATQAEASRRQLLTLIRAVREGDGGAMLPTVIAGFSQGGIMSASVALTSPDDVVGFAVLSGRILPEIEPAAAPRAALRHLGAFIAHGERDDTLPVTWAERADAMLTRLGVEHETRRYPIGHQLDAAVLADFARWVERRVDLERTAGAK